MRARRVSKHLGVSGERWQELSQGPSVASSLVGSHLFPPLPRLPPRHFLPFLPHPTARLPPEARSAGWQGRPERSLGGGVG